MKQAVLLWVTLFVSFLLLLAIPSQAASHSALFHSTEPSGQATPSPHSNDLSSRSGNVDLQSHDASRSISGSVLPMVTPWAVVAVTLVNNQSGSTGSLFQQMITFSPATYSALENSDLGNIRFCADVACSSEMFAWLESCSPSCTSSAASAIAWVLLPSAIAGGGGSLTIYIAFMPTSVGFDGVYWGEAPELSTTYGQYDNGASVFPSLYEDFVGTSLPAGWVSSTAGTGTVNEDNGLTVATGGGTSSGSVVLSNVATNFSTVTSGIVEGYVSSFSNGGNSNIMAIVASTNDTLGPISTGWGLEGYQADQIGWQNGVDGGDLLIENNNGGTPSVVAASSINPSPPLVIGVHGDTLYANYGVGATVTGNILGSGYIAVETGSGTSVPSITYDWMRVRAYPPAGVMPAASWGGVISDESTEFTVTFEARGLPTESSWGVYLNGTLQRSTSPSIAFVEPNGSYAFTVPEVGALTPTPSSGNVSVNGGDTADAVVFSTTSPAQYVVLQDRIGLDGSVNSSLLAFDSPVLRGLVNTEGTLFPPAWNVDSLATPLLYGPNGLLVQPYASAGLVGFTATTPLVAPFNVSIDFTPQNFCGGNPLAVFLSTQDGSSFVGAAVNDQLWLETSASTTVVPPSGYTALTALDPAHLNLTATSSGTTVSLFTASGALVGSDTSTLLDGDVGGLYLTVGSMEGSLPGQKLCTSGVQTPGVYLTNVTVDSTLYSELAVTASVESGSATAAMSHGYVTLSSTYYGLSLSDGTLYAWNESEPTASNGLVDFSNLRQGQYTIVANESQTAGSGTAYAAATSAVEVGAEDSLALTAQAPIEEPVVVQLAATNTQGGSAYVGMTQIIDNLTAAAGGGTGEYAYEWNLDNAACTASSTSESQLCAFVSTGASTTYYLSVTVTAEGSWFGQPSDVSPGTSNVIQVDVVPADEILTVEPLGNSPLVDLAYGGADDAALMFQSGTQYFLNGTITDSANVLTMPQWATDWFGVSSAWQTLGLEYGGNTVESGFIVQPGGTAVAAATVPGASLSFPSTAAAGPPGVGSTFGIVLDPTSAEAYLCDLLNVGLGVAGLTGALSSVLSGAGASELSAEILQDLLVESASTLSAVVLPAALNQQDLGTTLAANALQIFWTAIHVLEDVLPTLAQTVLESALYPGLWQTLLGAVSIRVATLASTIATVIGIAVPVAEAVVDLAAIVSTVWAGQLVQSFQVTAVQPLTSVAVSTDPGLAPYVSVGQGFSAYGRNAHGWEGGRDLARSDYSASTYGFAFPDSGALVVNVSAPAGLNAPEPFTLLIENGSFERTIQGTISPGQNLSYVVSPASGSRASSGLTPEQLTYLALGAVGAAITATVVIVYRRHRSGRS
jgi:hypothetical protein